MADVRGFLARRRVTLGFVAAAATLWLAAPTWDSWTIGLAVATCGEALRVWAAGHLEKSREVTRSGPYRFMRHPLYVGSAVMALGILVAARSPVAALLTTLYMVATLTAAIRSEEAFLRERFGDTYDRYAAATAEPVYRRFSVARAVRNREYRAVLGVAAGFGLLALKLAVPL
ncbi:MAG: isoprenylcysteine carboxylmethyltransferase family protein [Vicinamibacterales bacterium]